MKPCYHCYAKFDEANLKWCECLRPLRTLLCAGCKRCFCTTPIPYKRDFWTSVPRAMREAPERFLHDAGASARQMSDALAPVVLIVDDDEAIRSLVACRIRQLGYRAVTTGDPHHALMMARSREVAIVLTDALMPHMDGRELCLRLKTTEEGNAKKVIVMTSLYRARRYADEAVLRYNADAFLTKPIDFPRLTNLLAGLVPLVRGTALAS
jgi:CheY-like chemotaxis protein